ncbi:MULTISPECIES: ferritin-like domain-containing protein [Rhodococcus]|uniref:Ferritin-like domain-containing protein n=1 Tax=Rhodococcus oxybenzonivorans TaxID=1990687 RepID=A0AAE5A4D3_9NOCA|nr:MULTISPECIES: ferritin-like domain-containing protein [Rhodococcus]MDV7244876.1 ferritin-like domain-containing protein [Rhodococcus oxybenzonivorans]MDV7263675.1 ferritin-like domain-containing protein [Rhodococcus oxybenzonivorans]MDV7275625.1 ferritin-like domain-containing protein [Rhodococcus oxybenzonivorans]MDV7332402.1 ferritin-like domain-containing protein [Rhodococcus oxybenzonivorans]MDV7346198.1 ferritin-like domain-containing protein [Rhodococcus oxybenzonivorans]
MTAPTESEGRSLADALAAEHAAVFAYGVVAAFSNPVRADQVAAGAAGHRARRDALIDTLTAAELTAPAAEAGYTLPFPVTDPVSAAQLAARVEADTAIAWRAVVEHGETEDTRSLGVAGLTESAIREAGWRLALGTDPTTAVFPGQP